MSAGDVARAGEAGRAACATTGIGIETGEFGRRTVTGAVEALPVAAESAISK